jgi:hypothetical protein
VQRLLPGEITSGVAKEFSLTPGRISQKRGELKASWQQFQGEEPPSPVATAA